MTNPPTPPSGFRSRIWPVLFSSLVIIGLAACGSSTDEPDTADGSDAADTAPLELSLGESNAMASCLAVDAATLSQMAPAFKGTVTDVDGETISLDVDTWYAGSDQADAVQLHAEQGLEALIGGIDFQVGEEYFITAADGTVNYCGYSGPIEPTLTALFEEAFPT